MENTVVTWTCDWCKKESEALRGGITFSRDYATPNGWRSYQDKTAPVIVTLTDGTKFNVGQFYPYIGLGNDPRLTPKHPRAFHFCCEDHKQEWVKRNRPEPPNPYVPDGFDHPRSAWITRTYCIFAINPDVVVDIDLSKLGDALIVRSIGGDVRFWTEKDQIDKEEYGKIRRSGEGNYENPTSRHIYARRINGTPRLMVEALPTKETLEELLRFKS